MVNDQSLQSSWVARDHSGRVLAATAGLGLAHGGLVCMLGLAFELESGKGWVAPHLRAVLCTA